MDFSFNSDQQLIAETAATFLADVSSSSAVRQAMQSEQGFDLSLWNRVSGEMGWQMTHIPEQYDGLGLGYVELAILLEQMGQNLLCAPFFSTVCLGINSILVAGTESQQSECLAEIAEASTRYTLAYADAGRVWGCDSITAEYQIDAGGNAIINGNYAYVVDGHTAGKLIVAARQPGTSGGEGIALFIVPADTDGIQRHWQPGMDQTRKQAALSFSEVKVAAHSVMQNAGDAGQFLMQILSLAAIGMAAEQMGVAERSLQMTVEYISERKQFGRAVGSFQAMKHKAADMMTKVEAARSAVYYAACIADEFLAGSPLGEELQEAASIAKAYCCDAAFFNAGMALQMHGGVGFTWEYDVHLYFKRAKAAQVSFGDSAWHKERLAALLLDGEA